MAFDDIELPLRIAFGASGGPAFSTEIVVIDSGYERRNQNWAQARRSYDARAGVRSAADAAALLVFFHARAGRARGFRLRDWADCSTAIDHVAPPGFQDQIIATGDGATVLFPLVKNYVSGGVTHTRALTKPVAGTVAVGLDGQAQATGWSVDTTTGLITFASPPAAGATITAGCLFDVPVRFDTDTLTLTREDFATSQTAIPLVEIRV